MSKISIIIPCYNQEKYIAECLDSVLAQTFDDYEAIVVDDGSTDGSVKIIEEYLKKSDKIRLIKQTNQGVIATRNNAVKQATSKYIYFLDGDDIVHPKVLEKSYQAIESGKGDIISCKYQNFFNTDEIGKDKPTNRFRKPTKLNMVLRNCITNSALCRKSDFINCGGYDPAFSAGWEDYDLWLNMVLKHNLKIYRVEEFLFYYRLKDAHESRDVNANKRRKALNRLIHKKYPQKLISDIIVTFCRFIFQKKITRNGKLIVKIFKIPVFYKKL